MIHRKALLVARLGNLSEQLLHTDGGSTHPSQREQPRVAVLEPRDPCVDCQGRCESCSIR
jgi:hypothetical protein